MRIGNLHTILVPHFDYTNSKCQTSNFQYAVRFKYFAKWNGTSRNTQHVPNNKFCHIQSHRHANNAITRRFSHRVGAQGRHVPWQ